MMDLMELQINIDAVGADMSEWLTVRETYFERTVRKMIEIGKPQTLIFKYSDRKKIVSKFDDWAKQHGVLNCAESFLAWLWIHGYLNVDRITAELKLEEELEKFIKEGENL